MTHNRAVYACVVAWIGLVWVILLMTLGYTDRSAVATTIHPQSAVVESIGSAQLAAPIDTSWQVAIADAKTATTGPLNPAAATGTTAISMSRSFQSAFSAVTIRARYPSGGTLSTAPVVRLWGVKGTDYQSLKDSDGSMEITLASAATDQDTGTYAYTESCAEVYVLGSGQVKPTLKTAAVCAAGPVQIEISRH